ncbi:hypothetical protein [Okeania sp. SIO2B3]|uniref:hypothetical protein n=1 Tax=Okeania sp. SIO2B3 TaxID=2607784 RepID=UPI0013BEF7E5|nr:hypothetical protein [Okeania sp. SIO2B3]NET40706.1 hypothetical protein [Okeania sp. SIO2B3]
MRLASKKSVGVIIDNQQIRTEEIFHDIRTYNLNPQNDQFRKYAAEVSPRFLLAFFATI